MIKFIKTKAENNDFDQCNVTFEIVNDEISLPDLLTEIEYFIRAIGFNPKVVLDFVEEDEVE